MPQGILTDKKLKSLKTDKKYEDFWDSKVPGFVIRIFPSGTKKFNMVYRDKTGGRRRFVIGDTRYISLADARDKAHELLVGINKGEDPSEDKRKYKECQTMSELCDMYLELHSKPNKRPTSYQGDKRCINHDILPAIGNFKIVDVKRRHIVAILDTIGVERQAPVQANRTRALLSRVFNFAIHRDLLESSPVAGLPKTHKERARDRVLNRVEIKKLFEVLDTISEVSVAGAFKLLLLTGQRESEVLGLRWSEIDGTLWQLPKERSKNHRSHTYNPPLSLCLRSTRRDPSLQPGVQG